MYGLSFSEEFFTGTCAIEDIKPSERPTSVLQASVSLSEKERIEIAREVFGYKGSMAKMYVESDDFDFDVVEKVRNTDLCDDLSSPVTVYIDSEGFYTLTIYEEGGPDKPEFITD